MTSLTDADRLCWILCRILYTKKDQLLSEKWFKERAAGSLVADLARIPAATVQEKVE